MQSVPVHYAAKIRKICEGGQRQRLLSVGEAKRDIDRRANTHALPAGCPGQGP